MALHLRVLCKKPKFTVDMKSCFPIAVKCPCLEKIQRQAKAIMKKVNCMLCVDICVTLRFGWISINLVIRNLVRQNGIFRGLSTAQIHGSCWLWSCFNNPDDSKLTICRLFMVEFITNPNLNENMAPQNPKSVCLHFSNCVKADYCEALRNAWSALNKRRIRSCSLT